MLRYILKRVVSAIITIWFIMTLTFFLMKAHRISTITSINTNFRLISTLHLRIKREQSLAEFQIKCRSRSHHNFDTLFVFVRQVYHTLCMIISFYSF